MTCVVIDVGNTSTAAARFRRGRVQGVERLDSAHLTAAGATTRLGKLCEGDEVEGVALASGVREATQLWLQAVESLRGEPPLVVSPRVRLGVKIRYPKPDTIGADRLANACAAQRLFGSPVIVADFGTALTFDIIDAEPAYIGGAIAPGLPLMTDYLNERTALLPHIELRGRSSRVGKSTAGAMRIGARVGYRGMVREIVGHVRREPGLEQAGLCATGGYARWALRGLDMPFKIEPNLTLKGLGWIFGLNRS